MTQKAPDPLMDEAALAAHLARELPDGDRDGPGGAPGREPLRIERHMAGHSNETFFVGRGDQEWVLRRPPRGAFLPTAHDVVREYRVLSAVADTAVRAPRPVLLCEDASVIGAPFYLMERVHGFVMRDTSSVPEPFASDEASRRRIGEELVDALAELHGVDWRAAGLEGFGKPTGYIGRQLRRWRGQLALTEPLTRPVPDLHRVGEWLQANMPPEGSATIVHGDYKNDNVAYAFDPPARLVAIFDWEMSTIGDPLADLGWMISFWREPGDPVDDLEGLAATRLPGFPTRDELVERYREQSGRSVSGIRFYEVLAVWKVAILLEGSYARHLSGMTDDPFFQRMEEGVPRLARRALELTRS